MSSTREWNSRYIDGMIAGWQVWASIPWYTCPKLLDSFTDAYIQCALWASTYEVEQYRQDDDSVAQITNVPMEQDYTIRDISNATLGRMIADCKRFQEIAQWIMTAIEYETETEFAVTWESLRVTSIGTSQGDYAAYAGHDFWLTRNGHGAGFWDGDWEENAGERLTELAKSFGEFNLYVGDDGKVYGQ